MIAIIDYGMGNLHSAAKAFVRLGAEVTVTDRPEVIAAAAKVVLPGVGAFGDCMRNLHRAGLVDVIRDVIARGVPFLGICVGLQMLFEGSEEDPDVPGLGVFPGMVRRLTAPGLKVPHMGWNSLELKQFSPLFQNLPDPAYVYFVHSYHAAAAEASLVTAVTEYGGTVTAAVGRGNVQAVQFHPEKSGAVGLSILANFKEMV
ncbi:imidazole glycerol phosphate synthase subunit HisH [Sporolituus thermophilus]|uniref:Imidazole glycerol phosphate synthase subunit HisH n=1 Tax=Sporolituus thermophilus DSM 23256 TaxID=1123285 RepID=A0A1G7KEJ1_9FIRM|nr:imidazole glycerol phosphate synthase subunit HisH [Sporolituus thermophilus]SDF35585.1 glutamine amidotransferase [Sporolituus thermophilus DSM 23256]